MTLWARICRVAACFKTLEYETPEVRKRFVLQQQDVLLQVSVAWSVWLVASGLARMFSDVVDPTFLGIYVAPAGVVIITTLLSRYVPLCRYYHLHLLCVACVGIIALAGASVHEVSKISTQHAWEDSLKDVVLTLQSDAKLSAQLRVFVVAQSSREAFWQVLVTIVLMLDVLKITSFDWWARSIYFLPPIMVVAVANLSPYATLDVPNVLTAYILISVYFFALSFCLTRARLQQVKDGYLLEAALVKESESNRVALLAEAARTDAGQRTDTMLNHILKNLMADARGCIDMYFDEKELSLLREGTECLEDGMDWCAKRQGLLDLALGRYTPKPTKVPLPRFGTKLVGRKPIECEFPDHTVVMDPTVCSIILSNALNNAFQHGHRTAPQVAFIILLRPPGPLPLPGGSEDGRPQLTFRVTNRADPHRSVITMEFLRGVLGAGLSPAMADSDSVGITLGLQGIVAAAQYIGMMISLTQAEDTVTFEATIGVEVVPGDPHTAPSAPGTLVEAAPPSRESFDTTATEAPVDPPLTLLATPVPTLEPEPEPALIDGFAVPAGLTILCIDDSVIAQRLMARALQRGGAADVRVFGRDVSDVDAFLSAVEGGADILILDQYIDYGAVSFRGTDIARHLLGAGFQGLVCIRSANTDAADVQLYYESGAHVVLGKDSSCQEMVRDVVRAYRTHVATLPARGSQPSPPSQSLTTIPKTNPPPPLP